MYIVNDIAYAENFNNKEFTVKEFENAVSLADDIEPMIVKRDNKKDLIVISSEQNEKETFLNKLEKSRKQYTEGKVHSARTVFKGMREKYGYYY